MKVPSIRAVVDLFAGRAWCPTMAAVVMTLAVGVRPAQAEIFFYSFDSGFFDYDINAGGGNVYHRFTEGGRAVDMPHTGNFRDPYRQGGKLRLQVEPDANNRGRSEFRLIHGKTHATDAPRFGRNFNYGFDFRIDSASTLPKNTVHISQVWQRGATGVVPFTLTVRRKTKPTRLILELSTKYSDEPAKKTSLCRIYENRTYSVIVAARPSYVGYNVSGKAKVSVYEGDNRIGHTSQNPRWGIRPGVDGAENTFDVRMGIYRPEMRTRWIMDLDNCWYSY